MITVSVHSCKIQLSWTGLKFSFTVGDFLLPVLTDFKAFEVLNRLVKNMYYLLKYTFKLKLINKLNRDQLLDIDFSFLFFCWTTNLIYRQLTYFCAILFDLIQINQVFRITLVVPVNMTSSIAVYFTSRPLMTNYIDTIVLIQGSNKLYMREYLCD